MARSPRRVGRLPHRAWRWALLAIVVAGGACSASGRRRVPAAVVSSGGDLERTTRSPRDASERSVRILLGSRLPTVHLGADGGWRMYGADGTTLLALPEPRERWLLEQDGRRVSARREDASAVPLRESPIVVRPLDPGGTISFNGRRWRGELLVSATEEGLVVVNRLRMDDYLR